MRIVVWGDTHFPFHDRRCITRGLQIVKSVSPTHIVQIGDLYDMFGFSKFPSRLKMTPADELVEARIAAEDFWKLNQKYSPKAECHQIFGNHDVRPLKRMVEKCPELCDQLDMNHLWEFPGVITHKDPREEVEICEILFMHGYRSKLGDHAKHNMRSTVVGHSHRGGTFYFPIYGGKIIWELNAGYCGDPMSDALKYTPQKYQHWTPGIGYIDQFGPRFIAL